MVHMAFSMTEFMRLVKVANWHFTLEKSSLKQLIHLLGGPAVDATHIDIRAFTRAEKIEIQDTIWPLGVAGNAWSLKKKKYREALNYLARELFAVGEDKVLKLGQPKDGWNVYMLRRPKAFLHCSGVTVEAVYRSGGLDPKYSTEFCYPGNGFLSDWSWNEFVFCFPASVGEDGSPILKKRGAQKFFGFSSTAQSRPGATQSDFFLVVQKEWATYMAQLDVELGDKNSATETAFPYKIPLANITPYRNGVELTWQAGAQPSADTI